ncbi:hypothetical protein [Hymenobacter persicinus]|uniref:Uncharacterized protein n=1 Tax=Hymenobacter persicinus TaxID=2025506 RepID=A0A4V1ZA81_9BACT|nr:hypothetical protein [Hymenobacter persicinus]RYU75327.1 hypothetical protein EWM57_20025 [Hymenobacter persicinus]
MKTQLTILAAALLLTAGAARAQTTPTSPQRAGVGNQTTLPPTNPTMPSNPGTISQQSTDQQPTMQRNTNLDVNVPQGQTIERNAVDQLPAREKTSAPYTPARQRAVRRGTSPARTPATTPPSQR